MSNKNKGLASLAGMAVATLVLVGASDPIYDAVSSIGKDGEVIETKAPGFGGDVVVETTIGSDGSIKDVQVVDCSTETDTIGQAAAPEVAAAIVEAQDVNVDGVAGATMTSTAIKTAVAEATGKQLAASEEANTEETEAATEEAESETTEEAAPEGAIEASAAGFGGDVKVAVVLGEDGSIEDVQILDCSTETDTIGQVAAPEVAAAIVEAQSTDVDGVSGATMTSNAVKEAVASVIGGEETTETEEAETEETEEDATVSTGEAKEAEVSAEGFGGEVKVSVSMNEEGKITAVKILDCSTETPDVGQAAAPEVARQILAAQSVDVDGVAGATMTSDAIKEAVSKALAGENTSEASSEAATEEGTEETEAEPVATGEAKTAEASAAGFGGDVTVSVSVDEEGKITAIKVLDYSTETPDVGQAAAPELTKAIMAAQSTDVDGVSGATMTSNAIKEAVQTALDSMK